MTLAVAPVFAAGLVTVVDFAFKAMPKVKEALGANNKWVSHIGHVVKLASAGAIIYAACFVTVAAAVAVTAWPIFVGAAVALALLNIALVIAAEESQNKTFMKYTKVFYDTCGRMGDLALIAGALVLGATGTAIAGLNGFAILATVGAGGGAMIMSDQRNQSEKEKALKIIKLIAKEAVDAGKNAAEMRDAILKALQEAGIAMSKEELNSFLIDKDGNGIPDILEDADSTSKDNDVPSTSKNGQT